MRRSTHCAPIVIEKGAWLGAAATVMPGVTIGENAVVAANAVVSRDVPRDSVVGGVPAVVIKSIERTRAQAPDAFDAAEPVSGH
jgi:acetyltransferase-like isoleucine patch superfamily enzyme